LKNILFLSLGTMEGPEEAISHIHEIQQNLAEYQDQLDELRVLQKENGEDPEIEEVIKDLEEAVTLSKELLKVAKQREREHVRAERNGNTEGAGSNAINAAIMEAPEVKAPAVLGEEVKRQLRERQQRAALEGKVEAAWAIGAIVRDGGSDGREGVVRGVSKAGKLIVTFGEVGDEREFEATELVYLDDAQRQKDAVNSLRDSLKTVKDQVTSGSEQPLAAIDQVEAHDRKRKASQALTGKINKTGTKPKTDKATDSWQNFKAGKKVSKKMTGVKAKKEARG
jgi:hypothetical protein